jgi:hypothetical protein
VSAETVEAHGPLTVAEAARQLRGGELTAEALVAGRCMAFRWS